MNLLDIIQRSRPAPWAEGDNIPWNDPEFSERMLLEHLSQQHDAASRRFEIIDRHVAWISSLLPGGLPVRILDLACGPGLYSSRLARRGHRCHGIDYSPASIRYALQEAETGHLACTYLQEDLRAADFGADFDLAMLLYGEFNIFSRADIEKILQKAHAALKPGGILLLEPHTDEVIERIGLSPATWTAQAAGLFSAHPHITLEEPDWDKETHTSTIRFYIIDAESGEVTRHAQTFQAYSDAEYTAMLEGCGFEQVCFYPALASDINAPRSDLLGITARK